MEENYKVYRLRNGNIKVVVFENGVLATKTFVDYQAYTQWKTECANSAKS